MIIILATFKINLQNSHRFIYIYQLKLEKQKNFKMFFKILIAINLIYFVSCWPVFELYTRSRPSSFVTVTSQNLASAGFSHTKETKFIVHGFSSDPSSIINIKTELLKIYDVNVIMVNWKQGAQAPDYFSAASNTRQVGEKIAKFITDSRITTSRVHCIGHSLGAHVCGFAGKNLRIGRISGMDPAGPLFKGQISSSRLDYTDADFVDVIHTDSELGIQDPIGHLNFYPNGGKRQSGCLSKSGANNTSNDGLETIQMRIDPKGDVIGIISCSHGRSHQFYAQSVSRCPFTAIKCTSYSK